jgi:dTDP-4-dehydrorhamnose reductase
VKPKRLAEAKLVASRPRNSSLDTSKAKELS